MTLQAAALHMHKMRSMCSAKAAGADMWQAAHLRAPPAGAGKLKSCCRSCACHDPSDAASASESASNSESASECPAAWASRPPALLLRRRPHPAAAASGDLSGESNGDSNGDAAPDAAAVALPPSLSASGDLAEDLAGGLAGAAVAGAAAVPPAPLPVEATPSRRATADSSVPVGDRRPLSSRPPPLEPFL